MKVYDCFCFYNEFELLELRLKSLNDVVDYFVLVEADKTQTHKPKPFYFNERKNDFAEFLPKIRHLMVKMDVPDRGVGDWTIENLQRNAIAKGLTDAEPEDLVFISDLDEIWAPDVLQRINNNAVQILMMYPTNTIVNGARIGIPCQPIIHSLNVLDATPLAMHQQMFSYYINRLNKSMWQGSIITKYKNLSTPQALRNSRVILLRIMGGGCILTVWAA